MTVDSPVTPTPQPSAAAAGTVQIQLAVLTALAGGLLAAGSYLGIVALLVAVCLVQLLLAISWLFGTAVPGRMGGLVLAVLAAAGADAATMHWSDSGYSPVLGVLGMAVPLLFAHQLSRGVVRTRVLESLGDITVLLVALVALAGLLVLRRQDSGDLITPAVLGAITAGLVAGHFTDAVFPVLRFDPAVDRGLPAVVVGVLVGAAVGLLGLRRVIDFTGGRGAFVGAAIAAVACLLSIGAAFSGVHSSVAAPGTAGPAGPAVRLRPVAAVLMTLALSTPAAYVLVNALSG
ncbi:MAG TPA: hypothetical protein VGX49_02165 [Jatrophihabitans sp.]|nr:hypothetical protein [Jatrophihabitans sp.]